MRVGLGHMNDSFFHVVDFLYFTFDNLMLVFVIKVLLAFSFRLICVVFVRSDM
jgi:hypothetical protein